MSNIAQILAVLLFWLTFSFSYIFCIFDTLTIWISIFKKPEKNEQQSIGNKTQRFSKLIYKTEDDSECETNLFDMFDRFDGRVDGKEMQTAK